MKRAPSYLCFMNSRAELASWGAVFAWSGSQRTAFFRFRGLRVVLAKLRGRHWHLGAPFSGSESLVGKLRGRHFFRFRGSLVVFDELRGGTSVLGRRFQLVGNSEGDIFFQVQRAPGCGCGTQGRHLHLGAPFFKSKGRLDGATGFCGRHFFSSQGALSQQSSRAAFSLKGVIFSEQVSNRSSVITHKKRRRGAGRQCLPCLHGGYALAAAPCKVFSI